MSHLGRVRPRVVAAVAALVTTTALLAVPTQTAHAKPPPNPSDGQIHSAQQEKNAVAGEVGSLSAQIATLQTQLSQQQGRLEMAEQKYAFALQKLQQAQHAATQAKKNVAAATKDVAAAQREFVAYAQATYMSGDVPGTTGTLLTADDPNVLLQQGELQKYQSVHQIGAVGDMQRAQVAKSNADAAARKAVKNKTAAAADAAQKKQAADAAVVATRQQQAQTQQALAASRTKLASAQSHLATLNGQRAKYNAYVAEQARIAAAKAAAKAKREREARAAAAAAAARERSQQRSHHSSGGGGGSYNAPAPTPSGGSWTAARGRNAAHRAEQYLGWMYAWAGGNSSGPTYGVCAGDGAFNDCHVIGFDCSGLAMYAWGPYLSMDHYAAAQYGQAGSYHPSFSSLRPGDLVFWSYGGRWDIHHVAIYIGGGQIIEAPESGVPIRIASLYEYGTPYGATRPLT